ncbi:hypothetical protein Pcinc_019574 [Petrolisthes cinctipes]|uniref:C1q domain-containing protein n=1 Tax=Petrolisthes cinctipes TaxID=88211 RepID=A0AAE1KMI0_PETCI|nr:hypothetical protein Pcinc_019574 [Petrolisthes cinctipes]
MSRGDVKCDHTFLAKLGTMKGEECVVVCVVWWCVLGIIGAQFVPGFLVESGSDLQEWPHDLEQLFPEEVSPEEHQDHYVNTIAKVVGAGTISAPLPDYNPVESVLGGPVLPNHHLSPEYPGITVLHNGHVNQLNDNNPKSETESDEASEGENVTEGVGEGGGGERKGEEEGGERKGEGGGERKGEGEDGERKGEEDGERKDEGEGGERKGEGGERKGDGENGERKGEGEDCGGIVAFSVARAHYLHRKAGVNGVQVLYDKVLSSEGPGFNHTGGYFRCHCPGLYFFSIHAVSPLHGRARLDLMRNRQRVVSTEAQYYGYGTGANTIIIRLHKNDIVYVYLAQGFLYENDSRFRGYASFTGYRIG